MSSESASNDNASNGDDSETTCQDYSTPASVPQSIPEFKTSTLHDTSRSKYHMKDLSSFASNLEKSASRAFPNREQPTTRYKTVQVLLLRWKDDDLDVCYEVEDLEKVFRRYGFDTETWLIPTENSHLKLMIKAASFVELHESLDTLFVVYYGGHAMINPARQSTWSCKRDLKYASLEWSAIQTLFEKASSDVLLLLDCCSAASAAPLGGRAITETIAACGWESIAAEPGRFSFTDSLIRVLEEWINKRFTAAMLHSELLSRLKHEKPEVIGTQRIERRRTPIYIVTTSNLKACSIQMSRMIPEAQCHAKGEKIIIPSQCHQPSSPPSATEVDSLTESLPNGQLTVPHVLISLALEEDQLLDAEACSEWLSAFPALAKYAKVQSVFKSYSTLLLVSVPVMIWDLLPEDSASSFIGYVCSDNLLRISAEDPGEIATISNEPLMFQDQLKPSVNNESTRKSKRSLETYLEDLFPGKPDESSRNRPIHWTKVEIVEQSEPSFTSSAKETLSTPAVFKPSSEIKPETFMPPISLISQPDAAGIENLLSSYWQNFHPIYPIVHRATFDPDKDSTLLLAMTSIGSQYLYPKFTNMDIQIHEIHEECREKIDLSATWSLTTMQAMFLVEIFTRFRGLKTTVSSSRHFKKMYDHLVILQLDAFEDPSQGLDASTAHSQDKVQANLKTAWKNWFCSEAYRRLMSACFTLDTQQSVYHEQLTTESTFQQQLEYLPWLPCSEEIWEASSATIWESRLSKYKAKHTTRVDDALLKFISPEELQKMRPFPQSILVCSQFSKLPAREDPTYPNDFTPYSIHPTLATFMSVFNHNPKADAFLLFYHTPLHDLLAIAGDTWVFSQKITSPSTFHMAQARLRNWSTSLAAAAATQYACRILKDELLQPFSRSGWRAANDQSTGLDGCISDYWVLYIASLVCWAFGHRYQSSAGSTMSLSSCASDNDSAIDIAGMSGYPETKANQYLTMMLERSIEELLTSEASVKSDTSSVVQVVKLRLEKEREVSSSEMLLDAILVLNKVAQGGGQRWF